MDRNIDLPMYTRLAPISSVNAEARTADLIFTTGARVKRYDWERSQYYWEELSLNPAHVRMARLQSGAPLLDAHNRFTLESVLGVVEPGSAKVDGKRGTATVRFSNREEVEPVFRDVKDKIITNVSAGYVTHRMEQLPPDASSEGLPIYRATDWEVMELSLVPIGADAGAIVRNRNQEETRYPCTIILNKENQTMENTENTGAEAALETAKPTSAELHRTRTIRDLCTRHGFDTLQTELIDGGVTLAEARNRILAEAAKITDGVVIRSGFDVFQSRGHDTDNRRDLMTEALAARMGGPAPSDAARQYVGMKPLDMMRFCLEERGIRTTGMSGAQMFTRVSHSSTDFPQLLAGAGNRVLREAYQAHASGITRIFKQTTAPDFRAKQILALSEAPELLEVLAGGEIKQGTMTETKESYTLVSYARIFGINRQALFNDDLGAFAGMAMRYGQAAAEKVASTLTTLVNSNPTLTQDSFPVFGTGHVNLTTGTAGAAINVDNLGVGIKKVRLQEGISGNIALGLAPKYLLVPAALEQLAKQYTSSQFVPALASSINPWNVTLEPIVEPRLDALSATAWYLFTDPAMFSNFEFAYLEGEEGPQMFTREGFEVEGMEFKVRLDLGAGATEFRGAYKNAGA